MSRLARKSLAVVLGLILGWYAAGMMGEHLLPVTPTQAQTESDQHENHDGKAHPDNAADHDAPAPHAAAANAEHDPGADHDAHAPDAGQRAAAHLVPQPQQIPFFRPVVAAVAALFALAVGVGLLVRSLGHQDPGIAAIEYDQAHVEHHHAESDHGHH